MACGSRRVVVAHTPASRDPVVGDRGVFRGLTFAVHHCPLWGDALSLSGPLFCDLGRPVKVDPLRIGPVKGRRRRRERDFLAQGWEQILQHRPSN